MHDLLWKKSDDHPPLELMLLYLDGGLEGKDLDLFTQHLNECWTCMADLESMKAGICSFIEFRDRTFAAIPLDPRVGQVRCSLTDAAREDAAPDSPGFLSRFAALLPVFPLRPAWIAGGLSAVLLTYLLFFSVATPPRLMAAEFLKRAQTSIAARQDREQHKVVYQDVRIRRGAWIAKRRIVRGAPTEAIKADGTAPPWTATLTGPLTWDDPLDLESFLHWRAAQSKLHEEIADTPDLVTLTSRTDASAPIREASVTVRRADWRLIAKRVEMADGSGVEATEIAYDVREVPQFAAIGNRTPRTAAPLGVDKATLEPMPSRTELDEAEIRVRALLFRLGMGLGEEEVPPSIRRRNRYIAVEGVISSADRRRLLQSELAGIPNTLDEVREQAAAVSSGKTIQAPDSSATTPAAPLQPPVLRSLLIRRLGSEQAATDFSNRILADSGRLFALTVQYHELAKRYSRAAMEASSPQIREQVSRLAEQMERSVSQELRIEDELLRPLLAEHPSAAPDGQTSDWQDRAERVFNVASAHDRILARLFAVTAGGSADRQTAAPNLEQLQELRAKLAGLVSSASVTLSQSDATK